MVVIVVDGACHFIEYERGESHLKIGDENKKALPAKGGLFETNRN